MNVNNEIKSQSFALFGTGELTNHLVFLLQLFVKKKSIVILSRLHPAALLTFVFVFKKKEEKNVFRCCFVFCCA